MDGFAEFIDKVFASASMTEDEIVDKLKNNYSVDRQYQAIMNSLR